MMLTTTPHPAGHVASMLLLADGRLPAGGHAYSSGIEPALLGGLPVSEVPAYLRARAATTGAVDAATAAVTLAVLTGGGQRREVTEIEAAWAARTPSPAQRAAARSIGTGLLRLAQRVWPGTPELNLVAEVAAVARPIVLGSLAAVTGITAPELVRLSIYDDVAGAASALLKLDPRDPAEVATLTLGVCAAVDHEVPALAAVRTPHDIPAGSAPQAEAWAEQHAASNRRLFRG